MQYIKLQCLCNSRCAFRFVSFLFFWFYFLHLFLNCFSCSVRCYCLFRFDCIRSLFSFCFSVSPCLLSVLCVLRCPLSVGPMMFAIRCRLLLLRPWPLTYIEMSANRFSGSSVRLSLWLQFPDSHWKSQMVIWLLNATPTNGFILFIFSGGVMNSELILFWSLQSNKWVSITPTRWIVAVKVPEI